MAASMATPRSVPCAAIGRGGGANSGSFSSIRGVPSAPEYPEVTSSVAGYARDMCRSNLRNELAFGIKKFVGEH